MSRDGALAGDAMTSPPFLVTFTAMLLWCTPALAQASAGPSAELAALSDRPGYVLPDGTGNKWTGDLDGMIERRQIRILVPYSKTLYFVDRGPQQQSPVA